MTAAPSSNPTIGSNYSAGGTNNGVNNQTQLSEGGTGRLGIYNGTWRDTTSTVSYTLNTWHHIAFSCIANSMSVYWDGTRVGSAYAVSGSFIFGNGAVGNIRGYGPGSSMPGYFDDFKITAGVGKYSGTTITLPTATIAGDPYWANVVVQTELVGRFFGDSNFYDWKNNQYLTAGAGIAASGNAKNTPNSASFSGGTSNQPLSLASDNNLILSGDFTIEGWVYPSTTNGNYTILGSNYAGPGGTSIIHYFQIGNSSNGSANRWVMYNGSVYNTATASVTMTANTWYYVVASRQGSTLRFYMNGTKVGTDITSTSTFNFSAGCIGAIRGLTSALFVGNMSGFRLTNGVARYTGTTMVVPPMPFMPGDYQIMYNKALFHFDGSLLDSSGINQTLTPVGNISYATGKFNSCVLIDGISADAYIYATPAAAMTNFGTGDFTIEFWIKVIDAVGSSPCIFDTRSSASSVAGIYMYSTSGATSTNYQLYFGSTNYSLTTPALNTGFCHFVLCRGSGTVAVYFNGTRVLNTINSASITDNSLTLGMFIDHNTIYRLKGYYDELRISTFCRYPVFADIANYPVPISAPQDHW